MTKKKFANSITPMTTKTVAEFHETCGDLRLNGYEIATEEISDSLSKILSDSTSFKSLKKELTVFIEDRQKLVEFLRPKFDRKSGKYLF